MFYEIPRHQIICIISSGSRGDWGSSVFPGEFLFAVIFISRLSVFLLLVFGPGQPPPRVQAPPQVNPGSATEYM